MAMNETRKVYERPALVEIGSMAEKTEFFGFIDLEKLINHWEQKKDGWRHGKGKWHDFSDKHDFS